MSGVFDDAGQPVPPVRRTPPQRPRALLPTLATVVFLMVLGSVFVGIWTSHLWFSSIGYSSVYNRVLFTRVGLFLVFGLLLASVAVGNVLLAFRMRPILIGEEARNPTIERYQDVIDPIRQWMVAVIGGLMLLFGGTSAAGQWKMYLLWLHGVPFGQRDVYFGRDIGFFVFDYPWYRFLLSFAFTTIVIALLVTAATHYLYGGIRLQVKRDRVAPGAQIQLSVLLGLFMLVKAASYWLDRYGLATHDGGLFTGISYVDSHAVLPAKNILAVIALICALLFFVNVFRPGWMLPVLGFGLLILSAVLIGGIWPTIVERFQVKPSEPDKEAPYIAMNIAATRNAYAINNVKLQAYPGVTTDTPAQLERIVQALPGVRLIDPQLVSPAFEQLQQQRGFYTMPKLLDVDRYKFGNNAIPQDVVIGARELNLNGLAQTQRNWANDHTVYTHGYGVVAAFGDRRGVGGKPVWAEKNLPSTGRLGRFQQQVYYGESEPSYSIVGAPPSTPPVELNIPDVGKNVHTQNSTYAGSGGVSIGSFFDKLLYAAKFWDSSLLLSGRVNSQSKIIYDRTPRVMVEKAAPWLTVDGDPYPAVVDGHLEWIVDGFTTTASYPMSEHVDLKTVTSDSLTATGKSVAGQPANQINYVRNAVKATVDAYNGTVTLYQWDTQDPILKAWMGAFPGTVKPKSAIAPALMAHLKYPEDMFKVQRFLLQRYHVLQPKTFYGGSENWRVPIDPNSTVGRGYQPPFYLTLKVPRIPTPAFSLTSVYVPQSRNNLASFLAVDADATSKNYGKFTVLQLPGDSAVSGPGQIANVMSNDPQVSKELVKYKLRDSKAVMGNLLTLPVGNEMLYVQPVYTYRGGTGSYPILQFVVVSIGNKVGIGTSFDDAFANALGVSQSPPGQPPGGGHDHGTGQSNGPGNGPGTSGQTTEQLLSTYLNRAKAQFDIADADLRRGDLGGYQTANRHGVHWLNLAVRLQARGTTSSTPTPTPNPTTTSTTNVPTSGTPTSTGSTPAADGSTPTSSGGTTAPTGTEPTPGSPTTTAP